jgi:predicted DsbA family dithiol-disulfide isomerase
MVEIVGAFAGEAAPMIVMTHYLYVLSSWSLVAEEAVREVRAEFGNRLAYDWRIAVTDYSGAGAFKREKLAFYYARLEEATGVAMNLGWWHESYDWLVPDRTVAAARTLGATGSDVRLALARAGLCDGRNITDRNVACSIAAEASGLDAAALGATYDAPETTLWLMRCSEEFKASGVRLRPAFVLENELGDRVLLSGIWNAEPLRCAIAALSTDEQGYKDFVARAPRPG